jgi:predicted  nucleic acid-binding Zn-ribbon protein
MTMPATVLSLQSNETQETIDFLRRLASMMSGGRNAEMLQAAAGAIETLSRRATTAEGELQQLHAEHGQNLEQREVAELAADNLLAELNALKAHLSQSESRAEIELAALKAELADHQQRAEAEIASLRLQFAENQQQAETEIAALRVQLAEKYGHALDAQDEIASLRAQIEQRDRLAEIDRRVFTEEAERLRAQIQDSENGLANISAATEQAIGAIDESVAVVPVQGLRLARTQFGYLAKTFEKSGDVISLTMCEIGAQALDKALTGASE